MVRNRVSRVCFYFCSMVQNSEHFSPLPNGLEWNSESFLFRGTAGISNKPIVPSSAEKIFCRKLPTHVVLATDVTASCGGGGYRGGQDGNSKCPSIKHVLFLHDDTSTGRSNSSNFCKNAKLQNFVINIWKKCVAVLTHGCKFCLSAHSLGHFEHIFYAEQYMNIVANRSTLKRIQ